MNRKAPHLRKDSNAYRQKKNEEAKQSMKDNFVPNDLMNIPSYAFVRNEEIYKSLIQNLTELGIGIHLKSIDIYSLIELANTIDLLIEIGKELKEYGISQVSTSRDGSSRVVASPHVQMRNTTLNQLQTQMKNLQLTPEARQLLTESILQNADMATFSDDEDDELIKNIMKRF